VGLADSDVCSQFISALDSAKRGDDRR